MAVYRKMKLRNRRCGNKEGGDETVVEKGRRENQHEWKLIKRGREKERNECEEGKDG